MTATYKTTTGNLNKLSPLDRQAHDWFRFVLSFPPHLVREYLTRFGVTEGQQVLDPFAGTGTTLVECKKLGIASFGLEANPVAQFAAQVKIDWSGDPDTLISHAHTIAESTIAELEAEGIDDDPLPLFRRNGNRQEHQVLRRLPAEQEKLLLTNSISPLPLHKTLILLDQMRQQHEEQYSRYEKLALSDALVSSISNLHFGPEVGVGTMKPDAPVVGPWLNRVSAIAADLRTLREQDATPASVHLADARRVSQVLAPHSIDVVITSPPYPNEKDYTRTTRLESVLLGFVQTRADLQALKKGLVRSNTRGVYKGDQDDMWIEGHPEIERIADAIEARRIELGKTSGFERLYARVTKLYFGGMAQHLADLRVVLRPGAQLAYVVGDQASYLRVMIRTGQLLADIAEQLGYEVEGIDLFRTRLATATKEQLREEVVILRWPGSGAVSNARH